MTQSSSKPNLSLYTNKVNHSVLNKWEQKEKDTLSISLKAIKSKPIQMKITEKDIDKLFLQLDRISKNAACGVRILEMFDKQCIEAELMIDECQIVKIYTFDYLVPLNVSIEGLKGRVEVYVSKKLKTPSKCFNDFTTTKHSFKITASTYRFKTEYAYLNFCAINDSRFFIRVWFGDKISKPRIIKEKNHETRDYSLSLGGISEQNLVLKKMNAVDKPKLKIQVEKPEKIDIQKKIIEVVTKKQAILEKVKSEKFYKANKKDINMYLSKKLSQMRVVNKRKNKFEKTWLQQIFISKFGMELRRQYIEKKFSIKRNDLVNFSIITIQRRIIHFLYRKTNVSISIRRARNHMKLFHWVAHKIFKRQVIRSIAVNIFSQVNLKTRAGNVLNVIKGIIAIQKAWRLYKLEKQCRLEGIIGL